MFLAPDYYPDHYSQMIIIHGSSRTIILLLDDFLAPDFSHIYASDDLKEAHPSLASSRISMHN